MIKLCILHNNNNNNNNNNNIIIIIQILIPDVPNDKVYIVSDGILSRNKIQFLNQYTSTWLIAVYCTTSKLEFLLKEQPQQHVDEHKQRDEQKEDEQAQQQDDEHKQRDEPKEDEPLNLVDLNIEFDVDGFANDDIQDIADSDLEIDDIKSEEKINPETAEKQNNNQQHQTSVFAQLEAYTFNPTPPISQSFNLPTQSMPPPLIPINNNININNVNSNNNNNYYYNYNDSNNNIINNNNNNKRSIRDAFEPSQINTDCDGNVRETKSNQRRGYNGYYFYKPDRRSFHKISEDLNYLKQRLKEVNTDEEKIKLFDVIKFDNQRIVSAQLRDWCTFLRIKKYDHRLITYKKAIISYYSTNLCQL